MSKTVEEDLKGSQPVEDLSRARIIVSRSHAGDVAATAQVNKKGANQGSGAEPGYLAGAGAVT